MKEIKAEELQENPFKMIGKDWMLITAEKDSKVNMMTASWGGVGVIWGKNAATVYVRQSRYTKDFIDNGEYFSLCVLPETYREKLGYCGKISGRDEDKVAKTGLKVQHEDKVPYFEESKIVLICKKLYSQEMKPECFTSPDDANKILKNFYPEPQDWHQLYIAEITKVLVK